MIIQFNENIIKTKTVKSKKNKWEYLQTHQYRSCSLCTKRGTKTMLRHFTLILWSNMKII